MDSPQSRLGAGPISPGWRRPSSRQPLLRGQTHDNSRTPYVTFANRHQIARPKLFYSRGLSELSQGGGVAGVVRAGHANGILPSRPPSLFESLFKNVPGLAEDDSLDADSCWFRKFGVDLRHVLEELAIGLGALAFFN